MFLTYLNKYLPKFTFRYTYNIVGIHRWSYETLFSIVVFR